ncbi:HlyD family secretion protein [Chachezhania sediminis]|uniref:HlyD family secretion protein n=1 Tax=Chachezhania sediminis TaxID=2599291 RepID=UPI00131D71DE|nr:HlyD family secretion protein [Chachezhania sediminis]
MSRHDRIDSTTAKTAPTPPAPEASPPPASGADATKAKTGGKKKVFLAIALAAVLGGGYAGYEWWTTGRFMIDTDDAYVHADLSIVSSRVQGYVSEIPVEPNQHVKKGDVLVRIDDGDYRIALDQAEAKLPTLDRTLDRIDAQIAAAETTVTQARAQLDAAEASLRNATSAAKRAKGLAERNITSQATLDAANEALDTALANKAAAQAAIAGAQAQVEVLKAQRDETESGRAALQLDVDQAKRDLDLTVLRAPFDGIVANVATEEGELVSPGARLAAVVPDEGLYVEANFKETQLEGIVPGETAHITIDAFDGHEIEGKVVSIAPATGSIFSLLPADNATGNFTKIVQRVPVRIELPAGTEGLRAGLSVIVEIDRRTAPKADGRLADASE